MLTSIKNQLLTSIDCLFLCDFASLNSRKIIEHLEEEYDFNVKHVKP